MEIEVVDGSGKNVASFSNVKRIKFASEDGSPKGGGFKAAGSISSACHPTLYFYEVSTFALRRITLDARLINLEYKDTLFRVETVELVKYIEFSGSTIFKMEDFYDVIVVVK